MRREHWARWLAPLSVAPPAAALGDLVSRDAPAIGAAGAALLASASALWVLRERRPLRLAGYVTATSLLAGCVGAPIVYALAEGISLRDPPALPLALGFLCALGGVLGLGWGFAAGAALALAVRGRPGPARSLFVAGTAWMVAAVAKLAVLEWEASSHLVALLAGGALLVVVSPLLRARSAAAPDEPAPAREPQRERASAWGWGALALVGPGLALGVVVLERSIPRDWVPSAMPLLAAALVPALLAALAGAFSARGRAPVWVALRALFACALSGLVCAPLTYAVVVTVRFGEVPADPSTLGLVSLFGGAIGAPVGLLLGVLFGGALALVARLRRGALARPIERASIAALWVAAGALALFIELVAAPDRYLVDFGVSFSGYGSSLAVCVASGLVVLFGLVLGARALLRLVRAWRLLASARRGRDAEYAVALRSELDADEETLAALPAYLPFGRLDGVLVRRADPSPAPFRQATVQELVALVPGPAQAR